MDGYSYIGLVSKPHSYKGKVRIFLENENFSLNLNVPVFVMIEQILVPFFLEEVSHNDKKTAILKFRDVNDATAAGKLRNKKIFVRDADLEAILKDKNLPVKDALIGYEVTDMKYGFVGIVKNIVQYPGHEVLEISDDKNNEILIPFNGTFVVGISHKNKSVHLSTPEGLIEMYRVH